MGVYAIKLPDVGEGIAEAELVEWNVAVGDVIREDDVIAAVMTDKANIEIPSIVTGTVVWLAAEVGDTVAVGAELIRLEVEGVGNVSGDAADVEPRPVQSPADQPSLATATKGIAEPESPPTQSRATPADNAQRAFGSR